MSAPRIVPKRGGLHRRYVRVPTGGMSPYAHDVAYGQLHVWNPQRGYVPVEHPRAYVQGRKAQIKWRREVAAHHKREAPLRAIYQRLARADMERDALARRARKRRYTKPRRSR